MCVSVKHKYTFVVLCADTVMLVLVQTQTHAAVRAAAMQPPPPHLWELILCHKFLQVLATLPVAASALVVLHNQQRGRAHHICAQGCAERQVQRKASAEKGKVQRKASAKGGLCTECRQCRLAQWLLDVTSQ